MESQKQPIAPLYTKLLIGTLAFLVLVVFMFIHVMRPEVTVPAWMFVMLLAIMGSCIGIDILDQYRGVS